MSSAKVLVGRGAPPVPAWAAWGPPLPTLPFVGWGQTGALGSRRRPLLRPAGVGGGGGGARPPPARPLPARVRAHPLGAVLGQRALALGPRLEIQKKVNSIRCGTTAIALSFRVLLVSPRCVRLLQRGAARTRWGRNARPLPRGTAGWAPTAAWGLQEPGERGSGSKTRLRGPRPCALCSSAPGGCKVGGHQGAALPARSAAPRTRLVPGHALHWDVPSKRRAKCRGREGPMASGPGADAGP